MAELSKTALAVQVRMNIRFKKEMSTEKLAALLKKEVPYHEAEERKYILAFFEEVYPSLMRKFMEEYAVSRDQILRMYEIYADEGCMARFKGALLHGKF